MRVLSVVVYMTKSRGPRTEPWGTLKRQVCREERLLLHLTRKQREDSNILDGRNLLTILDIIFKR